MQLFRGRRSLTVEAHLQVVAQHDAPVRDLFFVKEMGGGMLLTGSWDKSLRYWDLR